MIGLGKLQKSANVDGLLVGEKLSGTDVVLSIEDLKVVFKEGTIVLVVKLDGNV